MSKILAKIDKELDKIRPFLQAHGGDIAIASFEGEDGILSLSLSGACNNCPLRNITYENIVKSQLEGIEGVKEIKLINNE